ncbi:ATV_HP_G0051220.mRNA.1.CDS.1 [Saccharomyces cerevisiae]|nr:ATV_HP_G0051220.mRNA.1.CDS.1 [Saccharomyces cerevisiae]CAI6987680.1 ATV_HP_G0051220.mRNA.1.CDS.1 [Saccharomyces cerevisiae]
MSGHDSVTKISHILNEPVNEKVMVQNGFHENSKIADIELEIQERPSIKQWESPGSAVIPTSNHNFSPFLYTQFKSRGAAPFAPETIKSVDLVELPEDVPARVFHEKTGLFYQISPHSIPTFILAKKELPDPIKFYELVEDLGSVYGCVKLKIIPDADKFTQLNVDVDRLWFKARKQFFNSNEFQRTKIVDFYAKLYNFHNKIKKSTLTRIPSIDKRTLDLYRLRSCVKLRGGFNAVCEKKLWAQIGRELGYSGRIMSSLSTSLRSAYARILLDFDIYEEEEQAARNNEKNEDMVESEIFRHSNSRSRDEEEPLHKKAKIHRDVFRAGSINHEFKRMRDIKHIKGFPTYFNSLTEFKLGYTQSTETTLPGYDFTFWENGMEIYDKSKYETKTSPVYNLRQYYEKSLAVFTAIVAKFGSSYPDLFTKHTTLPQKEFERLYFHLLSEHFIDFEIDTGLGLPCSMRSPGNNSSNEKFAIKNILDQWNLDNIPLNELSLLQHLDLDMANFTRTTYDIGMLFSCQGWSVSDHFLPSIDFNHLGSTKLVYSIAPKDMEKFEALIARGKKEWDTIQSRPRYSTSDDELKSFIETDFYKSFLDAEQSADYSNTGDNSKNSFPEDKIAGNTLHDGSQSDFIFEPNFILANGIKLYKTTQEQGSYIFKFPKAFTCSIGSGFYLSQNAKFAPSSWLRFSSEAAKWTSKMGFLPGLDVNQLLINALLNSNNPVLRKKCRDLISNYVVEEAENSKKLGELIGTVDVVYNKLNYISDISLESTGLSKIVVTHGVLQRNLSLKEFVVLLEKPENGAHSICGIPIRDQSGNLNVCLHSYFDSASLGIALDGLDKPPTSYLLVHNEDFEKKWDVLMTSTFRNRTVPLNIIQYLISHTDSNTEFNRMLRSNFDDSLLLIEKCKKFIKTFVDVSCSVKDVDFGNGFNLRHLPLKFSDNMADNLESLYESVRKCSIEFSEKPTIIRLYHVSRQFPIDNRDIIDGNNLDLLKELYQKSLTIPLKVSYWTKLTRKICRLEWLSVYEHIFIERCDIKSEDPAKYSLPLLYSYFEFGLKYCDSEDIDKLGEVRKLILKYQDMMQKVRVFLKKDPPSKISLSDLEDVLLDIEEYRLPIQSSFFSELDYVIREIENAKKMNDVNILYNTDNIDKIDELIRKNDPKFVKFANQFNGSRLDKRPLASDNSGSVKAKQELKVFKLWNQHLDQIMQKNKFIEILPSIFRCLDLKSDKYIPLESSSKRQTKYCFCRRVEEGTAMVECEICKEWYHVDCISNGEWVPPDDPNVLFVCSICTPPCMAVDNIEGVTFELDDLKRILVESLKLSLIPDPPILKNLFDVFAFALNFKNEMEKELFTNGYVNQLSSTHKIKYYLRKLKGSQCGFTNLTDPLRKHCQVKDAEAIKWLTDNGRTIITGIPN